MLPRPPLVPPEVECPASVAALHGPGIVLFGDAVVRSLHCCTESIDGITPPELSTAVDWCGGATKWHGFVADCVAAANKQPGGLLFNWFKLGVAGGGPFGVCCLTCGSSSTGVGTSGRAGSSSPFKNYVGNHLKGKGHEKARDALLAQVEAAHAASGVPRPELAMQLLAERAGLVPSAELPHVELQPVGSETLGPPVTRSLTWSVTQPDQPATKQEQLDSKLGAGAFYVNDDESLAGCERCSGSTRRWS